MRTLAQIIGRLALVPVAALLVLTVTTSLSWSGYGFVFALGAVTAGMASAHARRRRVLIGGGFVLLLTTLSLRTFSGAAGTSITMHTDEGESSRVVDRLFDEGDVAVTATRLLVGTGLIHDHDAPELVPAMTASYRRMRAVERDSPSPVVATYLGLQSPRDSDTLVIEPMHEVRAGVIFLHGFAGNFTLPCWELARAVRALGVVTMCPSVGYRGDWWTSSGEATLTRTVAYAKARGIRHIYLAGLSNGGVGACRLAPRMQGTFEGLILISGADPRAPRVAVPVLVLQGRHDSMMPASLSRAYASRDGVRYVDLDAGHFAMLVRGEKAERAVATWLAEQLRGRLP